MLVFPVTRPDFTSVMLPLPPPYTLPTKAAYLGALALPITPPLTSTDVLPFTVARLAPPKTLASTIPSVIITCVLPTTFDASPPPKTPPLSTFSGISTPFSS